MSEPPLPLTSFFDDTGWCLRVDVPKDAAGCRRRTASGEYDPGPTPCVAFFVPGSFVRYFMVTALHSKQAQSVTLTDGATQ